MQLAISGVHVSPLVLITIGFCVGILGGFFGVGGSWVVTPALNILGFPMAFAIGTDLAHIVGKSIVATLKHYRLGHVDLKLGGMMMLGTALGVQTGKELILYLERIGAVEGVVRGIYVVVMLGIGAYVMYDYFSFTRRARYVRAFFGTERIGSAFSRRIQNLRLAPMIRLRTSGIEGISFWAVLVIGLVTGFLAGFLGGGAGWVRMPALVYLVGVPTVTAVGTDLFEIIFSAGIGTFLYALEGKVDVVAAATMLLGAAFGAQIGAIATQYVKSMRIRLYFAYTVLGAGLSVILKQWGELQGSEALQRFSGYLIITVAVILAAVVALGLVKGIVEDRRYWGMRR